MNKKQLAYLQSLLTPEQLTTFLELKKTRPKKTTTTDKIIVDTPECEGIKKDNNKCSYKAHPDQIYCGIHLKKVKALVKVEKILTERDVLDAVA